MSNVCYLAVIFFFLVVTWWLMLVIYVLLLVNALYLVVNARYWWLLLITLRYLSFPLLGSSIGHLGKDMSNFQVVRQVVRQTNATVSFHKLSGKLDAREVA